MLNALTKVLFGSHNEREIKKLTQLVAKINALEPTLVALDDATLAAQTPKLRARLSAGEKLDALLPEAFATVREAAKRTLGQRHFDVQLMGGITLHQGRIAEMRTGEGKTLVATLAVYLNALPGKGVHVVTVNDYLAKRDAAWMGQVYQFLGLSVGTIVHGLHDAERRAAYAADVTYGTNNEFGFDYLRDNMKFHAGDMVQRPFQFAIVDEVDSILIDEARTPLIISGPTDDTSELYRQVNALIPTLVEADYDRDEKMRTANLTEAGNVKMESLCAEAGLLQPGTNLYDAANISIVHHVNQALRAHLLYRRDVDYIVRNNSVMIIDEFTGRMMEGRRFSDGLHQALEAKENVQIQPENQTLASITFQNYFRLYPKLAGMTGTAGTEAAEFAEIYNLEVIEMPTNVPVVRQDRDDEIYGTMAEKYAAVAKQIKECRERQQPVLVGTVSIEKSEELANLLKANQIPHQVLNARYHEQEAAIIAQAGQPGAVTIATNMAGRGTDIQLGGNADMLVEQELANITDPATRAARTASIRAQVASARDTVKAAGGLFVIGTERHEARRIDNQLRGRSGRQGDPGITQFYLSLEDDLMRIFGGDNMKSMMVKLGLRDGENITHPLITSAIKHAQRKVEARNFDIRKNLLKYDNIINDQRKVMYEQRRAIMQVESVRDMVADMRHEVLSDLVNRAMPVGSYPEQWQLDSLGEQLTDIMGIELPLLAWGKEDGIAEEEILARVLRAADEALALKRAQLGEVVFGQLERAALLGSLDSHWKEHLQQLDQLRQGIHLRGYGQRDPLNEYTREAFALFQLMLEQIRRDVTKVIMRANVSVPSLDELAARQQQQKMVALHPNPDSAADTMATPAPNNVTPMVPKSVAFDANDPSTWTRTPRNAPCPCGSGKKYKHCHGAV